MAAGNSFAGIGRLPLAVQALRVGPKASANSTLPRPGSRRSDMTFVNAADRGPAATKQGAGARAPGGIGRGASMTGAGSAAAAPPFPRWRAAAVTITAARRGAFSWCSITSAATNQITIIISIATAIARL